MLIVGSIVIRVDDLDAQIAFWTRALDYVVREPTAPPRIHLDLYADDQAAEVERLTALGARVVPWDKRPADADYLIMEDPEGVRFCVIDAADWTGWAAHRPDPATAPDD